MKNSIQVYYQRSLAAHLISKANKAAIAENPDNAPKGYDPNQTKEAYADIGRIWKPGRRLKITFMDGQDDVKRKVEDIAQEWTQYANLIFDFGDHEDADIRISFDDDGSWSYIGTDALQIEDEPTMNFGWLNSNSSEDSYSRVVLHEFGHALGLLHEHQNPIGEIKWNRPAVYAAYSGYPNYWSEERINQNFFNKFDDESEQTEFDPLSIMIYPIPKEFLLEGHDEIVLTTSLSEKDKVFIGTIYPFS